MAEFCKKCFVRKFLNPTERQLYQEGKLKIIETDFNDFCEGCSKITKIVDHIEEIE